MPSVHDRGGRSDPGPIDRSEHEPAWWEKRVDAMVTLLAHPARRLITVDEHRRAIESLEAGRYEALPYYAKWLLALETLCVEKGLLTREEIDRKVASGL